MSALRIGFRFASLFQFANMMRELLLLAWKCKKKKKTIMAVQQDYSGECIYWGNNCINRLQILLSCPEQLHNCSTRPVTYMHFLLNTFSLVSYDIFFFSKKKSNEFLQYFVRFFIFKMKVFQPKKDWIFSFQTKKLFKKN